MNKISEEESEKYIKRILKNSEIINIINALGYTNFENAMKTILKTLRKQKTEVMLLKVAKEEVEELLENAIPRNKVEDRIKELDNEKQGNQDYGTIQAIILDLENLLEE